MLHHRLLWVTTVILLAPLQITHVCPRVTRVLGRLRGLHDSLALALDHDRQCCRQDRTLATALHEGHHDQDRHRRAAVITGRSLAPCPRLGSSGGLHHLDRRQQVVVVGVLVAGGIHGRGQGRGLETEAAKMMMERTKFLSIRWYSSS